MATISSMAEWDRELARVIRESETLTALLARFAMATDEMPINAGAKERAANAVRVVRAVGPALQEADRITKKADAPFWSAFVHDPRKNAHLWNNNRG